MPGITKHCGGYAESVTPDIWGDWVVSPPQLGAYTLDIDFAGFRPNATTAEADDDDAPPPDRTATADSWLPPAAPAAGRVHNEMSATPAPAPPFRLGKSYAIYANESLTAWGGNAVLGDDGLCVDDVVGLACESVDCIGESRLEPARKAIESGQNRIHFLVVISAS